MVDFCERAPWKIFMSNVWKFELCLKGGKHKKWKQLPKLPEAQVHGWVHTWQIEISKRPPFSFQEIFFLFSNKQDGFGSKILGIYIVVTYWMMVDFCERAPWKNFMSNVWKFELCLKAGKHKKMETTTKSAWSTSAWLSSHLANWDFKHHFSPFKKFSPSFPRNRMDLDLRS